MGMVNESLFAAFGSHDQNSRRANLCVLFLFLFFFFFFFFFFLLFFLSSPEQNGQWAKDLVSSIGDMGPIKFEKKNDNLRLTLTF